MMDGDLQDPPELIPVMLQSWGGGSDVVYAVRTARPGETRFKLATARQFYKLMSRLSNVPLAENSGDFRLLDRQALDALLAMRERARYLRGMTAWIGFTQTAVPYTRDARYAGETKYPLPQDGALRPRRDRLVQPRPAAAGLGDRLLGGCCLPSPRSRWRSS